MRLLHLFRDPPLDGPTNMARDEHLLHSDARRPAALRIYGWDPPTLSLGYFQKYAALADLDEEVRGLMVVRRLTGGGAILHDREVTYCLVCDDSVPLARRAPVELYRLAHVCWCEALALDGLVTELAPEHFPLPTPRTGPFFCFERPGRTDLLLGGVKLLGSAQRRLPGRVLQHGSLLLERRFAVHPGAQLAAPSPERVERWIAAFVTRLAGGLDLQPQAAAWTDDELKDATRRRARYAGEAWTRLR